MSAKPALPNLDRDSQDSVVTDGISEGKLKRKSIKNGAKNEVQEVNPKPKKRRKSMTSAGSPAQAAEVRTNEEVTEYIDLGKKKRATVRSFKGAVFLDIREYFDAGGEEKPGKKGISLSLDQWEILKSNGATIDSLFERFSK